MRGICAKPISAVNHFILFIVFLLAVISCAEKNRNGHGLSSSEALETFTLEEGFEIALVAAEPLVSDPVAMEIDENGNFYVVEMHGYPLDKSGTGKIKLLTDRDGDGQMDASTVFAEGLILPTGIMRWKQGVVVTDPPDVLYLEDTDGNGKADVREVLLTGFAVSNPQHNLNSPMLGLDNWIYLAHEPAVTTTVYAEQFGDKGAEILFPGKANSTRLPVNAGGRSVRFQPDHHKLEALSSRTQFGHSFDGWGRHLLVNNSNHAIHEVMPASWLARNPYLLVTDATQSLSDHGSAAEVFPTTTRPELQMLTNVGVMTSACGITAYLGGAFPEPYNQHVTFVAEPVSNLVHADILNSDGASFKASRVHARKEFLTSTDAWFRPVNMYVGPSGEMYVIDYYRQIIEHPEWMSEEVNQSGALYNGTDMGRIYRITAKGSQPGSPRPTLAAASEEELVSRLSDPNSWWRRHAQRMIVARGGVDAVPALSRVAATGAAPYGRLHALWTLEGLGKLTSAQIRSALQDSVAGIRENAVQLAALHLPEDGTLANDLLKLKNDSDFKVKFNLLGALGFVKGAVAEDVRRQLLFAYVDDPWMQIAALSTPGSHETGLLEAVLKRYDAGRPGFDLLIRRLSAMTGAAQAKHHIRALLARASDCDVTLGWQAPVLEGLAQGMSGRNVSSDAFQAETGLMTKAFFEHPAAAVRKATLNLLEVVGLPGNNATKIALKRARVVAGTSSVPVEKRAEAIHFLALGNPDEHTSFLKSLIVTGEPLPLQAAAIRTLSAIPDQTVSKYVLEQWPSLTPEIRDAGLNTFFPDTIRIRMLLDAIAEGKVERSSVGFQRSVRLRTVSNVLLRNRARALFDVKDSERQEIIDRYTTSLAMKGDYERGERVFRNNCSMCHQIRGGSGALYGPDLGSIHNWPSAGILANILDPNQSISDGFDTWEISLANGKTLQGIIAVETPNALTLRHAGGEETVISRQDIASLKTLGISTMPTGLEAQINTQEMADLLAFLKHVQ